MISPEAVPLICENLTKSYAGQRVVNSVNLVVAPGELTALVGQSGAGKTTLLRLLAGMERPDAGVIRSGEKLLSAPSSHSPPEKRQIGLIFQDFALFPHLNVIDNICFGLTALPKANRKQIAFEWLERLNLSQRAKAFPHQLSGGEQQRVAIARALAPEPVAILMDEPFSGLDPALREQARDVALHAIQQSATPALLVTHDAAEAMEFADQIAIMSQGKLVQTGAPSELYLNPNCLEAAQALGTVQSIAKDKLPDVWQSKFGGADTLYMRPEAIQLAPSGKVSMRVMETRRTGLLVCLKLQHQGNSFKATILSQKPPQPGDQVHVSLDAASVFQF